MERRNENQTKMNAMKSRSIMMITSLVVISALILIAIFKLFETNNAGYYQVKQSLISGKLSVRNTPGTYMQNFGKITTYRITDDVILSKEKGDKSLTNREIKPERVLFPNGYADIDFVGLYEIPLVPEIQIELHIKYGNNSNLQYMIKQQITEALKNTATLMSAEEAYSNKRSEFIRLSKEQALFGLYESKVRSEFITNSAGQNQEIKHYSVNRDTTGKPIIMKESLLGKYDITLPQFNIKDMDFDDKLIALIDSRKDAQKAQQDAITEKAKGETRIAKEKADQEVDKFKQVTIAQKEKEVAELNAEKAYKVAMFKAKEAEEERKALISKGQGEAEAARLKVSAGLTPQERVEWEYKTKVGVATELAKIKVPTMIIVGNEGKGGANPMDMIGVSMGLDVMKKMEDLNKNK